MFGRLSTSLTIVRQHRQTVHLEKAMVFTVTSGLLLVSTSTHVSIAGTECKLSFPVIKWLLLIDWLWII